MGDGSYPARHQHLSGLMTLEVIAAFSVPRIEPQIEASNGGKKAF
jgi:hypothetical protein